MTKPIPRHARTLALAMLLVVSCSAASSRAATITIVNQDAPGQGFNDPTPVAPVGGNPGTTLGQQRLGVFQTAASIWGGILQSSVPILVDASWAALPCDTISGVLGSAGPNYIFWDFTNAPLANTSYTKAEADKLFGADLYPGVSDIAAQFNSSLGTPGCLSAYAWYYGYDHQEADNQIDLLPVLLHEIGHGLGFLTFVDDASGQLAYGVPDIYSRFILDAKTGLHWSEETDAQRASSDTSTFRVLWDGPVTREHAAFRLGPRPLLRVSAPAGLAGDRMVGTATFGPALTSAGVSGDVVLADDGVAPTSDACSPLVNAAQVAGRIALVDRGGCSFAPKVKACQDAGALGVVVVNNLAGSEPTGMSGVDPTITIPSVRITKADGDAIRSQLGAGVHVTLLADPSQLAGADAAGRVMLYAPDPNQPGSSISHWDVTCSPNLLMEPNINADLTSDVDLTRYALWDMGWFIGATDAPLAVGRPTALELAESAPNPFRQTTKVSFRMPEAGDVDLAVFDLSGRRVRRLVAAHLPAGTHDTTWDGTDEHGRSVRGGAYFCRLRVGSELRSRSMLVVR